MAKDKKPRAPDKSPPKGADPLQEGVAAFAGGDYARARVLLLARAADTTLSESQRSHAKGLAEATHVDRGAVLTGLACVGLYLLVLLVTSLTQP